MAADDFSDGDYVRAKRLGWNEKLDPVQEFDLIPFEDEENPRGNSEIEGELQVIHSDVPSIGELTLYLVGGQEADPGTIEAAAPR